MGEIERIEEERLVESMICLWIQPDAPEWIIDHVRQELRKQRGLLEGDTEQKSNSQKWTCTRKNEESKYSEEIEDELVSLMIKFLENHEIFRLLELVVSAVATKEQEGKRI